MGIGVVLEHLLDDLGLELAVGALGDFHQVEVLDRIVVGVELEAATQRVELGLHHGRAQRLPVRNITLHLTDGAVDQERRVVGLECVGRGDRAELLLIGGDKALVLRIVEIRRPVGAAEEAERGILLGRQRRFIDGEGGEERDVVGKPRLPELLDEIHSHAAGQEHIDGVGFRGRDLGEFGREVELVERHVNLVRDLALEKGLEAGERILARLVVGRHQEHFLDPGVLGMLARYREDLIVLVRGDEEVRIAFLAGKVGGAGVGADQDRAAVGHGLHDRGENVGKDRADDEIDLVPVDQCLDLVHREVGLELVVRNDHLDIAAAELAVEILDRKIEAVAKLLTQHSRRSG